PHVGRGGWTWYTGSASWMYRLGIEMILGMQRKGDHLQIKPSIPGDWSEFQINYRFGETRYHILVRRPRDGETGRESIMMDGKPLPDHQILLSSDGGTHEIVVTLPPV